MGRMDGKQCGGNRASCPAPVPLWLGRTAYQPAPAKEAADRHGERYQTTPQCGTRNGEGREVSTVPSIKTGITGQQQVILTTDEELRTTEALAIHDQQAGSSID